MPSVFTEADFQEEPKPRFTEADFQDSAPIPDLSKMLRDGLGGADRPIPSTPEQLAMQNFELGGRRMLKRPGPIEIIPGSGITTEREGDNIFPRVQTPPEAGALEKIAAGVVNTAGGVGNFMLSPLGVATLLMPEVAGTQLAGPILKGLFGGMMAKSAGEMAGKASVTGDVQDWTEAGLAGAGAGLVTLPGLLPPRPPPVEGSMATGELLKMPEGSAVPLKVPLNLPDAARAPEPPVVTPKAESPTVAPVKETAAQEGVRVKNQTIKDRIASGIKDDNLRLSIFPDQVLDHPRTGEKITIPGNVQVDEIHPELGNTFSSNPEQLNKLGLDIPDTSELKKLPMGKYTLSEARAKLAEMNKPAAAPTAPPAEPTPPPAAAPKKATEAAGLAPEHVAEMRRQKEYFPYRIVYGVLDPETGKFEARATTTRRPINVLVREGKVVYELRASSAEPTLLSNLVKPEGAPGRVKASGQGPISTKESPAPPPGATPTSSVGLSDPVDISQPAKPKRAYSGARYQADAEEFKRLVEEHAHEHGWISATDMDKMIPGLKGKQTSMSSASMAAIIPHNAVLKKAYLQALKDLGIPTDRNTIKGQSEALPKLKALLEKHASMVPVPLAEMPDGSKFTRLGEDHTVKGTNQKTGMVRIEDGIPINVHMDESVKIDPGSLKTPEGHAPKLRPGEKGTADILQGPDAPFNLAGEVQGDPARIAAESKAKADSSAAAKALVAKQQQDLFSPKSTAPEKGMAGPGTPSAAQGPDVGGGFQNQSGADIYGIAQRVRQQRSKAGQVAPIATGQGVAAGEAVKWGQDLISMGVDPEKSMQEFERTRAVSFDLMAMGRGHGESIARTARSIEVKFGTDSNEYRMAQKALTDWDTRSKAMQTEWHKIGMAQQGETDIDTGSFTGISRAFKEATGQDLNPGQVKKAKKIAKGVSDADKSTEGAKPSLQTEIDKIGALIEPGIRRLADKIIAAMDKKAGDALARIRARQAEGRAFSVGDPADLDDVIIYGAAKITKGVVEFGVWSHQMLSEIGKGIEPHLKKIFDAATKYEDDETTRLAGGKPQHQKVRAVRQGIKAPIDVKEQGKVFADFASGKPMTPVQLKTLWTRAMEYIKPDSNDMADVVYKVAADLGISAKDVLKGLNQSRSIKRVADDVWQKQRQARILKQSAKQWIEHAQETWLQKALPASAKALFSAKVAAHGTVALGTHAPLVAFTHPIIFAQNFGKMYKLVASPEYYQMQMRAQARRANYTAGQRAGLVNDMNKMEDFNDPRLALQHPKLSAWLKKNLDKVHLGRLVGMGTRGYSVLKILRQDLFDHEWDKLAESKQTPDMAKAIADSVNHITGVDKAKLPSVANYALFAPKLLISRVKVIAGDPLRAANSLLRMKDMTPAEKWFATNQFKEKAKIFGTATGLLIANQQLNNLFGDKKKLNGVPIALGGGGINPMASDFMKFRVAGMNIAWGSPFLTMSRLPLRLVQIGMGSGGKTRFLIYPDESMYKTVGSYLRTQESPFLSPITSLLTKADWQDRPLPQIPGYGPPPPVPKRLAAQGIKPYSWLEFGSEILMPIPIEEGVKEALHYGLGATPKEQAARRKAFVITLLMAATGGRIQEDWNKPAAPPPWQQFR
jgi:hypothetical protein